MIKHFCDDCENLMSEEEYLLAQRMLRPDGKVFCDNCSEIERRLKQERQKEAERSRKGWKITDYFKQALMGDGKMIRDGYAFFNTIHFQFDKINTVVTFYADNYAIACMNAPPVDRCGGFTFVLTEGQIKVRISE